MSRPQRFDSYWRFVLSGLSGEWFRKYADREINTNRVDQQKIQTITDDADLDAIIEEGRRQIDSQVQRVEYASTRAQILLALGVATIGFVITQFDKVDQLQEPWETVSRVLMAVGGAIVAYGTAGAAAVLTARVTFTRPDTTQLANGGAGSRRRLAIDYAESVVVGENTAAARVTNLRIAVSLFVVGLVTSFVGVLINLWD